jgi:hypothetical protein
VLSIFYSGLLAEYTSYFRLPTESIPTCGLFEFQSPEMQKAIWEDGLNACIV